MSVEIVLLFGFALLAEIGWTIAGFGSSSIFLPLASELLVFKTALALAAMYHIFGNASRFFFFGRHLDRKLFLIFGIPSVVTTYLGAQLVAEVDQDLLKGLLGCVLFVFASYVLRKPTFALPRHFRTGAIGGALSGFTAGLVGTWGVLRGAFFQAFGLSKEKYLATIALVALLVDFTRIPVYIANGYLSNEYRRYIPFLFVVAMIGSWIGRMIVRKLPQNTFKTIVLVGVLILSLKLIREGFF